jgi:tetratricopeptide (TPR) repeat protein
MKKMILLGAAAIMMAFSASAQMSLVKDLAKKAASGNPQALMEVLQNIEPAFTNPESAQDVLTWYTAGKAAFGLYDELYKMKIMQQPVDDNMMNEILSNAYAFYMEALPLDSVVEVDKKTGMPKLNSDGTKKVKTKYSKDIIGALTSHMGDIAGAGNTYLQNNDWEHAADAFGNYANLATSDFAIKNGVAAADSVISQVRFFEGYSLYQIQKFAEAYDAFTQARKLGYTENNIVDFQTSSLANMVQGMLDKNDYDKAYAFIDNALKADPMNGTLHDIKGFTTELKDGVDAALPFYRKAAEVDPTYANAFFDVGRCLYLQAQKIIDDNPNATNKELVPKIKPIYDEAIPFLKKASELNPADTKAKNVLDDILYKFEVMGVN